MIDEAIEYLTKMLIRQEIEDRKNKKKQKIVISKVDLIKHSIKLLKMVD